MRLSKAQLLVVVQLMLFGLLLVTFFAYPAEQLPVLRIIGLILMTTGLLIVLAAMREHTKTNPHMVNVSPEPNPSAQLVESGLYTRIRHPIYTGVILGVIGAGLTHGHITAVAVSLLFIPFFTYKAVYEEKLLQKAYPQYATYMQRTGRFLPPLR